MTAAIGKFHPLKPSYNPPNRLRAFRPAALQSALRRLQNASKNGSRFVVTLRAERNLERLRPITVQSGNRLKYKTAALFHAKAPPKAVTLPHN